ncbi:hypothetical protein M5689_016945 [Euphorbia peplus]|nr:hypothetical protein M5689_016945 [Euphorbia peplus]
MVKKVFSSATILIFCFFFVILHKYPKIQAAAEARKLEDILPQNTTSTTGNSSTSTTEEGKGQSKTGVHGSESEHSGSATDHSPPNSTGSVQTAPPAPVTKVNYVTPRNKNNGANGGRGNYYYSPPDYPQNHDDYDGNNGNTWP